MTMLPQRAPVYRSPSRAVAKLRRGGLMAAAVAGGFVLFFIAVTLSMGWAPQPQETIVDVFPR